MQGAGYDAILASNLEQLSTALPGADALIVDLTADAAQRIEDVQGRGGAEVPTLAFYSHVESDVRVLAQRAGFDLVVPRSRMAREGARLMEGLIRATR
jgi:hypothetical protein